MDSNSEIANLVLYDGECRFCNSSVNFIFKVEDKQKLNFSALQSTFGQHILKKYNLPSNYTESILFVHEAKLYSRSSAVFQIASFLRFPWRLIGVFEMFPVFLSDLVYKLIAKHRLRLMGKQDSCQIPTASLKNRFLE